MSILLASKAVKAAAIPDIAPSARGAASPQVATVTFNRDGTVIYTDGSAKWFSVSPKLGIGDSYEIYCEDVSPSPGTVTGTLDAWLDMTVNRSWSIETTGSEYIADLEFSIRKIGDTSPMDVGVITMVVEVLV
jgi:hypothetical protein